MKNTLADLNNHLFEELERLGDESLEGDKLKEEINRATAISKISANIINNGNLVLSAAQFADEAMDANAKIPKMLKGDKYD